MDCNIVKDLLPLYCDDMTSEESTEIVREHLKTCETCRKIYEGMKEEDCAGREENLKALDPMKKIREKNRVRILLSVLAAAVLGIVISIGVFWGYVPTSSDNVDITYKVIQGERMEDGKKVPECEVLFTLKLKDGKCINVRSDEDVVKVYSTWKIPFDERGKLPDTFDYGQCKDAPFTKEDVVTFVFRDQTVEYSLKEISQEDGR